MQISILGIDIGKNSCSVVGVDDRGAVVVRRTMRRQTLIEFVEALPTCVIAMEACCGAHHLGRLFAARGHEVRLMSPEYVRPYVKAQKNDDRDAEGIAEAASRPTMRFVELKSQEQLDIQTLHRVRSRLIAERTTFMGEMIVAHDIRHGLKANQQIRADGLRRLSITHIVCRPIAPCESAVILSVTPIHGGVRDEWQNGHQRECLAGSGTLCCNPTR